MAYATYRKRGIHLILLLVSSQLSGCATSSGAPFLTPPVKPEALQTVSHMPALPRPSDTDIVQVGRYRLMTTEPTAAQQDLLRVMIDVTLPDDVRTIQDAVQYLLLRSGYQLTLPSSGSDVAQLLAKPVPAVHRHWGPVRLQQALETLAGAPFQLTVDPLHRQLGYELPQESLQKEPL